VYSCDAGKPDGSLYLEAVDQIEELEAEIKNLKAIMRGDGGTKKVSLKDKDDE
jgi:hypothetical protein